MFFTGVAQRASRTVRACITILATALLKLRKLCHDVTGTDIYWIKDGKIHGRWGNEDAMGMMEQLGYSENRGGPPPGVQK